MLYYTLSQSKRLHKLHVYYEKSTTDNLVKHGFLSTLDIYRMHGSNGTFLPRGGNGTIFFSVWLLDHGWFILRFLRCWLVYNLFCAEGVLILGLTLIIAYQRFKHVCLASTCRCQMGQAYHYPSLKMYMEMGSAKHGF